MRARAPTIEPTTGPTTLCLPFDTDDTAATAEVADGADCTVAGVLECRLRIISMEWTVSLLYNCESLGGGGGRGPSNFVSEAQRVDLGRPAYVVTTTVLDTRGTVL